MDLVRLRATAFQSTDAPIPRPGALLCYGVATLRGTGHLAEPLEERAFMIGIHRPVDGHSLKSAEILVAALSGTSCPIHLRLFLVAAEALIVVPP